LIAVIAAILFFSGKRLWTRLSQSGLQSRKRSRLPYLAAHTAVLGLFVWITSNVMANPIPAAQADSWAVGWIGSAALTLVLWCLALFPFQTWLTTVRLEARRVFAATLVGSAAWASGFVTQRLWEPFAGYTFGLVHLLLSAIYTNIVTEPENLIIGTPSFLALIAPECSGLEGVGLTLVFTGVVLWSWRESFQFPAALLLLPLGGTVIWILNALRITAFVVIGDAGWPEVAAGGFHSQAGWISFNAVALGLVGITLRGRYFMSAKETARPAENADTTAAYLLPFLAIVATAMLTGAVSAGFDWLYPLRVIAAVAILWTFRRSYPSFTWSWSWGPIGIGMVCFLIWLALAPEASVNAPWPAHLQETSIWTGVWLLSRVIGYVLTVPLAEELAFRGYLTRRIISSEFDSLPIGVFTWSSLLISSVLFGLFHGPHWLPGTITGLLFALALYRRRSLADAVVAHAITNLLLTLYVFATGRWGLWS
jgi:exosortase E/protease (VPEID-CTERM system)